MTGLVPKGTFNIVRQMTVDEATLQKIAELLGIPEAERGRLVSGTVYIGPGPAPSSRRARTPSRSAAARPASRRRRPTE